MKEEFHKWHSNYLDHELGMLVFGHAGFPVILFPTAKGRYYESKDNGLINAVEWFLNEGKIKIYSPDTVDAKSWYNYSIPPGERVRMNSNYENSVLLDVIDFALNESGREKAALAGCGLGGYHAINTAFRNPNKIDGVLSMGGMFDIKKFIMGYYDDECYFNNPPDYMQNLTDPWYLNRIKEMKIILGTGDWDRNLDENQRMSNILHNKNINHWFDVREEATHDWFWWRKVFPHYIFDYLHHRSF